MTTKTTTFTFPKNFDTDGMENYAAGLWSRRNIESFMLNMQEKYPPWPDTSNLHPDNIRSWVREIMQAITMAKHDQMPDSLEGRLGYIVKHILMGSPPLLHIENPALDPLEKGKLRLSEMLDD